MEQKDEKKEKYKSTDLTVDFTIRSSVEDLKSLERLSDGIVRCILTDYELVLVEKEVKVNWKFEKRLSILTIHLDVPD